MGQPISAYYSSSHSLGLLEGISPGPAQQYGRLERFPQLRRSILHGAGKALAPHRLRTLGGRMSITELPKRKDRPASADRCPFCHEAPLDSLTHALHDCRMDGWQHHCGWAMEAVTIMRMRYYVSTMTAILELHCPLNFSAPTKRDPTPRRDRKRATGSLSPVPFETVQRAQRGLNGRSRRRKWRRWGPQSGSPGWHVRFDRNKRRSTALSRRANHSLLLLYFKRQANSR
jgi:hypothetical protein